MREEGRAHPGSGFLGAARSELVWLGATVLVATATAVSLLLFSGYESSHRAAASRAVAAQLAAARIDALEWQTIAEGRLAPETSARVVQLLGAVEHHLGALGSDTGASRMANAYGSAMREEFQLLAAGRVDAARRVDESFVDPRFDELEGVLRRTASRDSQAAHTAKTLATAGEIGGVVVGFAVVTTLLLRFAAARRALVAAEVERRLLCENDKAKSDLISVVSHDLRTPLTSITGYLEILTDRDAGLTVEQRRRS